jgi:hypothetical protein
MPNNRRHSDQTAAGPHHPFGARRTVFSQRIAAGASGAEAARAAGYKPSSASQQAWRLLRDPAVQAEIERLRASDALRKQAELDRLLAKVEGLYLKAIRNGQCSSALRAVELELTLREHGARSLPDGVSPADIEAECLNTGVKTNCGGTF